MPFKINPLTGIFEYYETQATFVPAQFPLPNIDLDNYDLLNVGNINLTTINGVAYSPTGATEDLASTLAIGNSAGVYDIDLNNNDLLNVNNIDLTTINGAAYPPTGYTIVDASGVTYDNISSGLVSTDVQGAIDELNTLISGITETQDLSAVLVLGNNAGSNDIDLNNNDLLNVNNIDLTTINGAAYPPASVTENLSATLAAGNSAGIYDIDLNNNDLLNVNNIALTTINGAAYPPASTTSDKGSFGASADGSTTGLVGYITMPYNGTITGWQVIGSETGSCSFDVWKTASGIIPTASNSITGSEKPNLVSQQINSDLNLTTWATTSIAIGDIIGISLDSASSLTTIWLTVFTTKLP